MNTFTRNSLFALIAIFLLSASSSLGALPVPTPSPTSAVWNEKMQGLYKTLSELLVNVSSDKRYNDSANREKIESQIKTLSTLAHDLKKKDVTSGHTDPAIGIFADHLSANANEAYQSFHGGNRDYARAMIRSLSNSCIACHGRTSSGPQFGALPMGTGLDELKPLELGRFYSASRQFDRAVTEFQKIISHQDSIKSSPWDWEEAIKQSISIAVRVKHDPVLASSIVKTILSDKQAPHYIKQDAKQWKYSIDIWQKNPRQAKTEEGLFTEAQRLIAAAKKTQEYPMDHSADILYLRASAILFDLLELAPNGRHVSEALFMEAICNESISPRGFENLPSIFYEECIRKTPHSKIAQSCYRGFEQQTYLAFTGSSGINLPEDIKQKLLELWALALPKGQLDQML